MIKEGFPTAYTLGAILRRQGRTVEQADAVVQSDPLEKSSEANTGKCAVKHDAVTQTYHIEEEKSGYSYKKDKGNPYV